jgi:hypothetical protein
MRHFAHLFPALVFRLASMRMRLTAGFVVVLATSLALVASSGAALIGIYRNSMESDAQRGQIVKMSGESCRRGGSSHAFRIVVGKRTRECAYRTPVVGRDLEIAAVARLLSSTPKSLQHKAFIAINLRAGGAGARYQLAVYPLQRKAQLRKTLSDGRVKYLQIEKDVSTVKGLNKANELRLRAFNVSSGPEKGQCHVLAFVGNRIVADVTDDAAGELAGRASGFSVGAATNAKGVVASVDDVVARVPNPF